MIPIAANVSEGGETPGARAASMVASVGSALRSTGVAEPDATVVLRAVGLAIEPRVSSLDDDHHPAYLHPGRSVLILLRDVGRVAGLALATAAVLESEDEGLRLPDARVRATLGEDVAAAARDVPHPGDEALVERLLMLPNDVALAVLAERLDHLRHLHLRPDLERLRGARHDEVVRAWHPFAERVDARLATRYGHWVRTFARRLKRA
jgi:hypothetical protein